MKRLSVYTSLLIILTISLHDVRAFEGRYRRLFGMPRRAVLPPTWHAATTQPNDNNMNHLNEQPDNPERRKILLSSAAAFASAFALGKQAEPAEASPTNILEESEKRRIDMFERCAPSVVFIDTFTQKQDAFSPNSIEVPIGTGSGFVWDKEGHIGKQDWTHCLSG